MNGPLKGFGKRMSLRIASPRSVDTVMSRLASLEVHLGKGSPRSHRLSFFSLGLPRTVPVDSQNAFVVMRCSSRSCSRKVHVILISGTSLGSWTTFQHVVRLASEYFQLSVTSLFRLQDVQGYSMNCFASRTCKATR